MDLNCTSPLVRSYQGITLVLGKSELCADFQLNRESAPQLPCCSKATVVFFSCGSPEMGEWSRLGVKQLFKII